MESQVQSQHPQTVHQLMATNTPIHLVDVRSTAEYADGHAVGAFSVPLEQLDRTRLQADLGDTAGTEQPVYLICASGARAQSAAEKLSRQGLTNLALVDGGTEAWKSSRLPVSGHSHRISLERQTQIALGVLLLMTLAKGTFLHPGFFVLVGLLGVGLVVAGLTARCGLAALIARMPWNRTPGPVSNASP